jgi:heme-degrading monooxygenase HmoA
VGARTDTSGHPVESVEPLLLHKRLDGFEGSLALATRRSGEIATVTNWESEEALRPSASGEKRGGATSQSRGSRIGHDTRKASK